MPAPATPVMEKVLPWWLVAALAFVGLDFVHNDAWSAWDEPWEPWDSEDELETAAPVRSLGQEWMEAAPEPGNPCATTIEYHCNYSWYTTNKKTIVILVC